MNLNVLREYLAYDPIVGKLVWSRHNGFKARGDSANGEGRYITLKGKRYDRAKVVWFLQTEAWPIERITFNNGDASDLRWSNLSNGKPKDSAPVATVEQRLERIERLLSAIAEELKIL